MHVKENQIDGHDGESTTSAGLLKQNGNVYKGRHDADTSAIGKITAGSKVCSGGCSAALAVWRGFFFFAFTFVYLNGAWS